MMAGSGRGALRDGDVLLRVEDLVVEFSSGDRIVQAVSGISFDVRRGETLALVGESGSGKSTTGLAIVRLTDVKSGVIQFDRLDIVQLSRRAMRKLRPRLQMIFQDPSSALNPRRRIRDIVAEPLRVWQRRQRSAWRERIDAQLTAVGLEPDTLGDRRPSEFSGGQAQRVNIARALILHPDFVVCDEPTSALDVSIQAQILQLLAELRSRNGLTLVFVSHDLAVVKAISDRVAVLYLGKLCEIGDVESVYQSPAHPYTRSLLESVPRLGVPIREPELVGEPPDPAHPPSGCRFRTRCLRATEVCARVEPQMEPVGDDHFVACHHNFISEP